MEILYLTAFSTGLLGSLHCVGMCGPIALAINMNTQGGNSVWAGAGFIYNLGRIFSYCVLGLIFGLFGMGFFLAGIQQKVTLLMGLGLMVLGLFSIFRNPLAFHNGLMGKYSNGLKNLFGKIMAIRGNKGCFLSGIVNGFLPCGFVYLGLVGAVAAPGPVEGALYMMLFGAGTLPLMLLVSISGKFLPPLFMRKISGYIPYLTLVFAFLFIMRGLNLGIPYLSPKIDPETGLVMECCRKN